MYKVIHWILVLMFCCSQAAFSKTKQADGIDTTVLRKWQAGQTVSPEVVEAFGGIDRHTSRIRTSGAMTSATSEPCIGTTTSRYTSAR